MSFQYAALQAAYYAWVTFVQRHSKNLPLCASKAVFFPKWHHTSSHSCVCAWERIETIAWCRIWIIHRGWLIELTTPCLRWVTWDDMPLTLISTWAQLSGQYLQQLRSEKLEASFYDALSFEAYIPFCTKPTPLLPIDSYEPRNNKEVVRFLLHFALSFCSGQLSFCWLQLSLAVISMQPYFLEW